MSATIYRFHKKTNSVCPLCYSPMHLVFWGDGSTSLMCLKCHFGFNYKQDKQ